VRTPATSDPLLADLKLVELRIRTLLPPEYQDSYETVEPVPMRSAGLQYDSEGRVAWDKIWDSFCDLAMAGGPPHKGTLLEPATATAVAADQDRYDEVADEICRGIRMVTGLRAYVAPDPGWICVTCHGDAMAGWLVRAIAMENVAVRRRGAILELPVSPHFGLEKEIKNVITVIAKTCHYWLGHIPEDQQRAIGELFTAMAAESPLIDPDLSSADSAKSRDLASRLAEQIHRATGLQPSFSARAGARPRLRLGCMDLPRDASSAASKIRVLRFLRRSGRSRTTLNLRVEGSIPSRLTTFPENFCSSCSSGEALVSV